MEKIIHQTWKITKLNQKEQEWVDSVKQSFCSYEYKFWTNEDNDNLVRLKYPEFYEFFKILTTIEKCDFCRYLYIYDYGGIYLDLDVKMNKFIPLNNADVFLCDQTNESNEDYGDKLKIVIDPFFLAGNKKCKYFYSICQMMTNKTFKLITPESKSEYKKILYNTGPYMASKFYILNKHKYNIKILKDIFTTDRYITNIPKEQFYGIHMQMGSWIEKSWKL